MGHHSCQVMMSASHSASRQAGTSTSQRDTATGPLHAGPVAALPDSASSCSPLPESRLCLALLTTGCSEIKTADRETIRGNRAVRPKTPRGPYASTRAPLKYALAMPPTADEAQHRDCKDPAVLYKAKRTIHSCQYCQR